MSVSLMDWWEVRFVVVVEVYVGREVKNQFTRKRWMDVKKEYEETT